VPPEEQSGNGLSEVLDAVIKKTTEELGHKFNKQQSIANPALGKQFLEEVFYLSPHLVLHPIAELSRINDHLYSALYLDENCIR
jgi:hypothetical protein